MSKLHFSTGWPGHSIGSKGGSLSSCVTCSASGFPTRWPRRENAGSECTVGHSAGSKTTSRNQPDGPRRSLTLRASVHATIEAVFEEALALLLAGFVTGEATALRRAIATGTANDSSPAGLGPRRSACRAPGFRTTPARWTMRTSAVFACAKTQA